MVYEAKYIRLTFRIDINGENSKIYVQKNYSLTSEKEIIKEYLLKDNLVVKKGNVYSIINKVEKIEILQKDERIYYHLDNFLLPIHLSNEEITENNEKIFKKLSKISRIKM